ncbi:ATP-binding cassette domain-containing protein [Asticcacaulis sp. YBE204]|uniref:ATP-binding cassette domain-containing protein n=1 Tax=Asticcacaulis sp. YBE204 TaxID=1282363 RepID=UPI0003C3EEDF|nr:ABC transporter ATP-binding protein [Asticcacaulis sp. YBE204]ESQ78103.1 hypothetical protein AEYBE204_14765 [Asticcacaulis sp. YBE204]
MASDPALTCANLCVDISGRRIVRSVSLDMAYGQWFGILGVNGSGKTTFLNALAGRLPAADGRISIDDEDVTSRPERRARLWGFAPPPDSLPPELTAGVLLGLVAEARDAHIPDDPALLEALDYPALRGTVIGTMSAGQKQKIALMCAFVGAPRRIILDEPFNWLDPLAIYALKSYLTQQAREGALILTALHDVSSFVTRCDAGLLLAAGEVRRLFTADDFARSRGDVSGFEREIYERFRAP